MLIADRGIALAVVHGMSCEQTIFTHALVKRKGSALQKAWDELEAGRYLVLAAVGCLALRSAGRRWPESRICTASCDFVMLPSRMVAS